MQAPLGLARATFTACIAARQDLLGGGHVDACMLVAGAVESHVCVGLCEIWWEPDSCSLLKM